MTLTGATHNDLVKRAAAWLKGRQNCRFVLCETQAGTGESPDAIGWKYGNQSHLVEVKVSRSDFFADQEKPFRKQPRDGVGMFRWLMVPEGLVTAEDMDAMKGWGLLYVKGRGVFIRRKAERQPQVNQQAEISILVQAVANAQLCAPMDLNAWFAHPESAVGSIRLARRAIADKERTRERERTCAKYLSFTPLVRCEAFVASGYSFCSDHGGRTRGEKRRQRLVLAAIAPTATQEAPNASRSN